MKGKGVFMKMTIDDIRAFLRRNWKYLTAAVVFIVLVVVLVKLSAKDPKEGVEASGTPEVIRIGDEGTEKGNVDEDASEEKAKELVNTYFTAMANNDINTLKGILAELTAEDEIEVQKTSERTESYHVTASYTRPGPIDDSYIVYTVYEAKFVGIETLAPGMISAYVCTNDDGQLYIFNKIDNEIKEFIEGYINEDSEIKAIHDKANEDYIAALEADAALRDFAAVLDAEKKEKQVAAAEEPVEAPEEEQQPEVPENTPQDEQSAVTDIVRAKENVNIRSAASETAEKLGKLPGGETAERIGQEGDWSKIKYNDQIGYIKTEFLEGNGGAAPAGDNSESSSGSGTATGDKVTINDTVNVRKSASETSERIGVAYQGENYTRIMEYADGWSKISFNGTEGFVKTEFLDKL